MPKYWIQNETRGHISIELKNSGQSVFGIWDTGAGLTSVDEKYVEENSESFEYVQDIVGGDGSGTEIPMKLYRADDIVIGGVSFKDQYVLAFNFEPMRPYIKENVQFVIGYNLVTQVNWYFDFINGKWALSEK